MSQHQILWSELEQTFNHDIHATSQLLELLQQERAALEDRQYDQFQQLLAHKQQLLTELETHALARQQLLQKAGFNDESSTLEAADHQAPQVAKAWRQLREEWIHCQQLNEVNDRIAKRTHIVVGQMLDLLRGKTTQDELYTSKGNTSNAASGRTITNA
ncbi:MAG: flagellar protein FlgN [Spongiibacteraceae bacterium]